MASKPRSDAKLKSLPPHYKEALIRWLVDDNMSYDEAREKLAKEFSVRTSRGALSQFYATECFALRSSEAKAFAELVEKELISAETTFDKATLALVKQKAFERAYAKTGDVDELATLAGIIGDSHKLILKTQQLEFSREKFRQQIKTDVENGLDALHAEIKDNAEALQLFERMKALVMKSVEGKA